MAVRVYSDIQLMRTRELSPMEPLVIGIGQFHGGTASNIVCDHVTINGTIRTGRDEVNDFIAKRIEDTNSAELNKITGPMNLPGLF